MFKYLKINNFYIIFIIIKIWKLGFSIKNLKIFIINILKKYFIYIIIYLYKKKLEYYKNLQI